jgi:hypothetical protein
MTNKRSAARLAAAMIGAALLIGGHAPGLAQTATKPAKPAVKRTAPASAAAAQSDYWKIEYAMPEYEGGGRRSAEPNTVRERTPLDRTRLDNGPGSIGFSSGSGANSTQFSDGRSVPGMERYNQQPNSGYAGMSLSVPTLNNTLVPANTPWGPPR